MYADGSHALAECRRCYRWFRQGEMVKDRQLGQYTCTSCWDEPDILVGVNWHPPQDPEALRWAQAPSGDEGAVVPYVPPYDPNVFGSDVPGAGGPNTNGTQPTVYADGDQMPIPGIDQGGEN